MWTCRLPGYWPGSGDGWLGMLQRLVQARWLHYLLVGGSLYLLDPLDGRRAQPVSEPEEIVITAVDRERLRDDWRSQYSRDPSPAAERELIAAAIDDEILFRQAIALGLDRDQAVIRSRLAQLAVFLGSEGGSEADLAGEARRLGLDRSDVIVRRHLVQMMRLLASRPSPADLPDEDEVRAYFARHREAFRRPARFHLTHVYFSEARRGASVAADARAVLESLRATAQVPAEAVASGDPFVRDQEMRASTARQLEHVFGATFVKVLENLPVREWSGPVPSAYGLHLVWMHERIPGGVPALVDVRNQVVHRLLKERARTQLQRNMAEWRQRYTVRVDDLSSPAG